MLGRRPDGFHQVVTAYQSVDLADTLTLERTKAPAIQLEITGSRLAPGEDNLVVRAARRLQRETACRSGARIALDKRVPVGAGLGGGSSNAAITLLALNQIWECCLSRDSLLRMAAELGSDVPFFLFGGTALGWGRGTRIHPFPDAFEPKRLVLLYPRFEIRAEEAYSSGNWRPYTGPDVLTRETAETTMRRLQRALDPGQTDSSFLENDLEQAVFKKYPVLAEGRRLLELAGCEQVMLCGSGSTLLGVGEIRQAAAALKDAGEVFHCTTLSRENYGKLLRSSGLHLS